MFIVALAFLAVSRELVLAGSWIKAKRDEEYLDFLVLELIIYEMIPNYARLNPYASSAVCLCCDSGECALLPC